MGLALWQADKLPRDSARKGKKEDGKAAWYTQTEVRRIASPSPELIAIFTARSCGVAEVTIQGSSRFEATQLLTALCQVVLDAQAR